MRTAYGLTMAEESRAKLVGLLMVDRPRPVDPKWLKQVERNFGEYRLVPMTATGERGILCQMEIEKESQKHLLQFFIDKAEALNKTLAPLLGQPPRPKFLINWNKERKLWESWIVSFDNA